MRKFLSGILSTVLALGMLVTVAGSAQAAETITPTFAITGATSPGDFEITITDLAYTPSDASTCDVVAASESVDFGAVAATGVTVTADFVAGTATVEGAIPANATETLDVDVVVEFGTDCDAGSQTETFTLTDAFDYLDAPNITGISPTSGTSGTTVTITGTDLSGVTAVKFGTANALSFNIVDDEEISAIAPAGVGSVAVSVTAHGVTDSFATLFEYVQLAVTGVSQSTGDSAGGQVVTLTGNGFKDTDVVYFGTALGTAVDANPAGDQITVTTPAVTAGVVDIVVSDGTTTASLLDSFRFVNDPTILDFSPKNGPLLGGTTVNISGTQLFGDADELIVKFGTATATDVEPTPNGTGVSVTVPAKAVADPTAVKVTVQNKAGSVISSADFTYAAQTITSVSPAYGPVGGGNIVTITGTNLLGATEVRFGTTLSPNIISVTNTTITAVAPAGTGTVNVSVKIGSTTVTDDNAYTYLTAPSVLSITPNVGAIAGGTSVTITGSNLKAISKIEFGTGLGTSIVINTTGTSLTVITPSRVSVGIVSVTLTGPGGVTVVPNAFEYVLTVCVPADLGKIRFAKGSSALTDVAKEKLTDFSSAIIASGCDVVTVKRYKTNATTALQKAMAELTQKRVSKALKYLRAQLDAGDVTVTIERSALANQKTTMTSLDQFKVNRRIDFGMKS